LKAAVISLGSLSSKWVIDSMKQYFKIVEDIRLKDIQLAFSKDDWEVQYKNKKLGEYDCIYAKGSFRYATLLRAISTAYEKRAYLPLKPSSFTVGHDKILTQLELQKKGIPMPKTFQISSRNTAKEMLRKMSYPIVIKIPNGTQGKGVMFAESYSAAISLLDALTVLRQPFLVQEFVETNGTDIRAIVAGNEVIASMMRQSEPGDNRANIHAGGEGSPIVLDEYTQRIAVESAKACKSEVCAVDILTGSKGPVVIEINLSPGLQGITKATNTNVAEKIASYLYKRTSEFVDKKKKESIKEVMDIIKPKPESKESNFIVSELSFRGSKIMLPDIVTKICKFQPKTEYEIEATKENLEIKKL